MFYGFALVTITDSLVTASHFNNYFTNIAAKVSDNYVPSRAFTNYLQAKTIGIDKYSVTYVTPDIVLTASMTTRILVLIVLMLKLKLFGQNMCWPMLYS